MVDPNNPYFVRLSDGLIHISSIYRITETRPSNNREYITYIYYAYDSRNRDYIVNNIPNYHEVLTKHIQNTLYGKDDKKEEPRFIKILNKKNGNHLWLDRKAIVAVLLQPEHIEIRCQSSEMINISKDEYDYEPWLKLMDQ